MPIGTEFEVNLEYGEANNQYKFGEIVLKREPKQLTLKYLELVTDFINVQ